jgi:branched-chain amino acid transport system ATP-binding protein
MSEVVDAAVASDEVILRVEGLTKQFGGFVAVNDIDLAVRRGTIHSLIGPNGAGKTTLFNLLTRFLPATRGRIIYDGEDITTISPAQIAGRGMVRSFQISAVFPKLTALENVVIALQRQRGRSFDFWRAGSVLKSYEPRARELLDRVGLQQYGGVEARRLPYGRKRALEIATTLALEPKLMLLDEPTAGMAAQDIARIMELIRDVARDRTVLMVEHNLSVVSSLSDTITVLVQGKVLVEGDYETVSADRRVMEAYLGVVAH